MKKLRGIVGKIYGEETCDCDVRTEAIIERRRSWYGMTYHEDVAAVKGSFKEMLENGVYKADLFSDL